MAFALGFILGPFIGGYLSDPSHVAWFNFATPFWFTAILTIFNIGLVVFNFKETIRAKLERPVTLLTGIRNLGRVMTMRNLQTIFLVTFLLMFGFTAFTQFFGVFLLERFSFNQSSIGWLFAYIGLWVAISQGLIVRFVSGKISPPRVLSVSALLLALTFPILLLPNKSHLLFWILPFVAIFQGLTQPNATAMVSSLADDLSQGEVLGMQQAVMSLAQIVPPLISGLVAGVNINWPIILAAACTFLAWAIFVLRYRSKLAEQQFHPN
jgi:DHA1 family tetracycline resistance protein-like MFS transporter